MIRLDRIARTLLLCSLIAPVLVAQNVSTPQPKYPQLPSETPPEFVPATGTFDYVKKEVMIPMRDGVKLHTVIIVPKAAKHAPILLTRTPYEASELTSH